MDYIIVSGQSIPELQTAVKQKLDELYVLQGGISAVVQSGKVNLFQAMYRSPLALPDAVVFPPPVPNP